MRVVICGAGIGGTTAAALLERAGHDVVLLERAAAFAEVGAGIQLSPNGVRVLDAIGLSDGLRTIGTTPDRTVARRWEDDRILMERPLGQAPLERYGFPYYNAYRPDLIELLASALRRTEVRMEAHVVAAVETASGAEVELADGTTVAGDVVIGADGIHSAVRTAMLGPQPSRFSGYVAYRALVPRETVAELPVVVSNRMGDDRHLVSYFVGRQQRYYNLVCVVPEPSWDVESWTEPGDLIELRAHFHGWTSAVQGLLDQVIEPIHRWALHDRQPLERWSSGHITLLGDACHPMLPFMAQGACQAIEDGAFLRTCLDAGDEPVAALQQYEEVRKPRATRLQEMSWANATTFHLPDGPDQRRRDERLAGASSTKDAHLAANDWLYAYNAFTDTTEPAA